MGLTVRDCEILHFMTANRFLTVRSIADRFWRGKRNRNEYRRIKKLVDRGYIEVMYGDGGRRLGYRARRRGLNLLRDLGIDPAPLTDLGAVYRSGFDHDRTLLDLRNIFESSVLISGFQAEHRVRENLSRKYGYQESEGDGYKVPDALSDLRTAKGTFRVALELEMAVKSKSRYRRALRQLSVSTDWDLVFIVSAEKRRIELLKELLVEVRTLTLDVAGSPRRNAMYFAWLREFQERKIDGTFEGEQKSFSLTSLADELPATT